MIGIGVAVGISRLRGIGQDLAAAIRAALFGSGEKGVFYDPSDLTAEKIAFRKNLLTWTEDFSNAAWVKTDTTVSEQQVLETTANSIHSISQIISSPGANTFALELQTIGRDTLTIWLGTSSASFAFNYTFSTGVLSLVGTALSNVIATVLPDGWVRFTGNVLTPDRVTVSGARSAYVGDVTKGFRLRFPQLEVGSTATTYQKITNFNTEFMAAFPSHALYQDSVGTTPVTAVGQPVGLLLDKSQGLVLGPELYTPGSGIPDAEWTYAAGTWTLTNAADNSAVLNTLAILTIGKSYQVSFTVGSLSGGSLSLRHPNSSTSVLTTSAPGTVTCIIIAGATSIWFRNSVAGQNATITNISVKELPGNHATQATSTARPVLGRHPISGRRNLLNATDTLSTQAATVTDVPHVLSFTGTGTVTLTGASTAGPLIGTGVSDRVSLTFTPTAGSLTLTVSGSVTLAQLELGSTPTAYQKVTSTYDVTEAGVADAYHLKFDGVDDFMVTPYTEQIFSHTIIAGVDGGNSSNNGTVSINATDSNYFVIGSSPADAYYNNRKETQIASSVTTASKKVITADVSATEQNMFSNNVLVNGPTAHTNTNSAAANIYLGKTRPSGLISSTSIYVVVVVNRTLTTQEKYNVAAYVNSKTGAF